MPGFFDQPVTTRVPDPEPPETTLIRDLLARKSFDLQADPYGGEQMRQNSLAPAPGFSGSGGGPSSQFFYGDSGQSGNGGGGNTPPTSQTEPRIDPIRALTALLGRQTQTLPARAQGRGSFFDRMSAVRPNRDARQGLRNVSARGMQRIPSFDGGQPSGQLPGFDGPPGGGGVWGGEWSQYDTANATPWTGGWQEDENGMPIGPGGFRYTGSQHEFSGGMGRDSRNQIINAQRQGGASYGQWLQEVRRRMNSRPGMHQAPTGPPQQQFAGGRGAPRQSQGMGNSLSQFLAMNSGSHGATAGRVPGMAPQPPANLPTAPRTPQPLDRNGQSQNFNAIAYGDVQPPALQNPGAPTEFEGGQRPQQSAPLAPRTPQPMLPRTS